ncbi:MAG: hypothetical protein ACKKL6_00170 [Candidatus Komeilibacteria bacterium]
MGIVFKFIKWIAIIVILVVGIMFVFKLCPPPGPWMSPPWCVDNSFEAIEYETTHEPGHLSQVKAVNMSDTWGRNYNFNMIENTRNNIDSSFARVAGLGAEEVYVNDFHMAKYEEDDNFTSLDYEIVDEIFLNDLRDEAMTEDDIDDLVKAAHDNGMKLGIKHNMAFVDIGKYIGLSDIAGSVQEDYANFNSGHTAEWINDFFDKWTVRLVKKAQMYDKYGVDIISITPTWMGPTFVGQEDLANTRWRELITELRNNFSGEIQTLVSYYGFVDGVDGQEDWSKYDYYQLADIVELDVYELPTKYGLIDNPSIDQMEKVWDKFFADTTKRSKAEGFKLTVMASIFSVPNALNNGIVEFYDIIGDALDGIVKDWDYQADAFQALFKSLENNEDIDRIIIGGYWWDDAMDPLVKPRISLSQSIRNKPAQAVVEKWFKN